MVKLYRTGQPLTILSNPWQKCWTDHGQRQEPGSTTPEATFILRFHGQSVPIGDISLIEMNLTVLLFVVGIWEQCGRGGLSGN